MKYFIASDIHGSSYWCRLLLDAFDREQADRMILLGDILYHGPRNELPRDYDPKAVIAMLNALPQKPLCVRGNCEAEVDQQVLSFPVLADYAIIDIGSRQIFATHGHLYNEDQMPPLGKGDILLCGHFHVPANAVHDDYIYMNPGSVSLPKCDSWNGYMTYADGVFTWKDVFGRYRMSRKL